MDGGRPPKEPPPVLDCKSSRSDQDADGDTFTPDNGDCDDCDPLISPGAFEILGNDVDEDCDGAALALDADVSCDEGLDEYSQQADDAARALGLCAFAHQTPFAWGVRSASYRRLNGDRRLEDKRQIGLSARFGNIVPREGSRFLVMSTGVARDAMHREFTPGCDAFKSEQIAPNEWSNPATPPKGYPKDSVRCAEGTHTEGTPAFNDVGLEIRLRVPVNAHSLSFESMFFTHEYPGYVCSAFNDFFVVLEGASENYAKNILFDSQDVPVGVNTALLSVCRTNDDTAVDVACAAGPSLLAGTGFDREESSCGKHPNFPDIGGASTGWLRTIVPVKPGGDLYLRFRLWDSGDPNFDSTVILDNLRFVSDEADGPITEPITGGH